MEPAQKPRRHVLVRSGGRFGIDLGECGSVFLRDAIKQHFSGASLLLPAAV
jgi:hypothetical protein